MEIFTSDFPPPAESDLDGLSILEQNEIVWTRLRFANDHQVGINRSAIDRMVAKYNYGCIFALALKLRKEEGNHE
jgi:hypothetical protein